MSATISFPPGWLTSALETSSLPLWPGVPLASFGERGVELDSRAAWQRLRSLEGVEAPRIDDFGLSYRVIDVEQTDDGILHYARRFDPQGKIEPWALFFQEKEQDSDCDLLVPRVVKSHLLDVYKDPAVKVEDDEITFPELKRLRSEPRGDGVMVYEASFQNGHSLRIAYENGERNPLVKGLLALLDLIPLLALTQVDEIRLSGEKNAEMGNTFRKEGRLSSVLYPSEELGEIHTLYTLIHEVFGHGLSYKNRFLRREMIKIVCSGEEPPSDYARISDEEWFPEGVAERGLRVAVQDPTLPQWDARFPYLSGLILHLIGVMEDCVDPANQNISLWQQTMRPLGL